MERETRSLGLVLAVWLINFYAPSSCCIGYVVRWQYNNNNNNNNYYYYYSIGRGCPWPLHN